MKFKLFKSKKNSEKENKSDDENLEDFEVFDENIFTKSELLEYDKHLNFYYTNLINCLILFTYNSDELEKMEPILIDPLTELYEEMDYAFLPVCFETIFRNNAIELKYKEELLEFKKHVDEIPNEIWDYEFIGNNQKWKQIRFEAENLLEKLEIKTRIFISDYHKIISNEGETIFKGKKMQ